MKANPLTDDVKITVRKPESEATFAAAGGSNASQRVGDDWLEYLDSTGNIERYDGMCACYVCKQIKADYFPWKARKEEAKHLNTELCDAAPPAASDNTKTANVAAFTSANF